MNAIFVALTAGWARRRVSVMLWAASLDALAATRRQREEIRMCLQYAFRLKSARIDGKHTRETESPTHATSYAEGKSNTETNGEPKSEPEGEPNGETKRRGGNSETK